MSCRPGALCARFVREDCGQDLVEYAILTGIVTVGSLLVFASISTKMGNAYSTWQKTGQDNWIPSQPLPNP